MVIIGLQRGKKKNGDSFTKIHLVRDFDDYESKTGEGQAAETIFLSKEYPALKVGDEIMIEYGKGFMGQAVVTNIITVRSTLDI